jgi:hypothetical protein
MGPVLFASLPEYSMTVLTNGGEEVCILSHGLGWPSPDSLYQMYCLSRNRSKKDVADDYCLLKYFLFECRGHRH